MLSGFEDLQLPRYHLIEEQNLQGSALGPIRWFILYRTKQFSGLTERQTLTQSLSCHKDLNVALDLHISARLKTQDETATWLLFFFFFIWTNLSADYKVLNEAALIFSPDQASASFPFITAPSRSFIPPPSAEKPISLAHLARRGVHGCVLSWDGLSTA